MRKFKIFLINGIVLTITSLLMRTVGFSFGIYISNKIGTEALGVFGLVMSVYMFFITIATSGINIASTRIVISEKAHNYDTNTSKAMKKCISYSLLFGFFSSILLIIFSKYITINLLHNKLPIYLLYIVAISLPFISMSSALNGYFTAIRKNTKNALTRIFEQTIKIVSTTYLLSLFLPNTLEHTCLALILGETISEISSFLFIFILYSFEKRKYLVHPPKDKKYLKAITAISIPIAITSYIRSGLSSLKQLLIPIRLEKFGMSCEKALSQYGIISGMVMPVLLFPQVIIESFSSLLMPEFSYYYNEKSFTSINYIINKIFRISFIFSVFTMGVFLFYSDQISLLIYNNLEVSRYLKILCFLVVFIYLDNIIDNMLKGLDKQVGVMKCNILDLFISISCIYFLLPIFGINGYIIVIFISELLNYFVSIYQLKSCTNFKFDFKNWIVKPCICLSFSYLLNLCFNFSYMSPYLDLFFKILMLFIFYFIFLVGFKGENKI